MDIDLDRLLTMAAGCAEALKRRFSDLARLEAELEALEGRTCTGREWWRDKDYPTKTPKLYILHSINHACPLHGEPEQDDRLRVYVGIDRRKIAEARAALEREEERRELEARLAEIQRGLSSCGYHLRSFYGLLAYQVDDDGCVEPR